jgi:hypothetical protein
MTVMVKSMIIYRHDPMVFKRENNGKNKGERQ